LERDLKDRSDVGPAERSALRAQARAVDRAEANRDSDAVSRANNVYLELRTAAGLTSAGARPVDAFDELVRQLAEPSPGDRHTPNN
jgi:hypothetical protein